MMPGMNQRAMPLAGDTSAQREVYTVSRLNREARTLLESRFPLIWLEGEVSNFARPGSGHWYFTLKDAQAQVRCAMFRPRNAILKFTPEDGMHLLVRARVSLYEGRGEFQLIVEHAEPAGEGLLQLQFEQLKKKLAAEGLFAEEHKQPLPRFARRIGVITSPTGAAIRDILSVLRRRFPALPVIVYPVAVQGAAAAPQIAAMIRTADARAECDVLVLARGGGSLEDLWPFNEEVVARAIYACTTPIVTGIGHEIDFTIADFVADVRAPTPSASAELVSPDRLQLSHLFHTAESRLVSLTRALLSRQRERLNWLARRLVHPGRRLQELAQRLDDISLHLLNGMRAHLHRQRTEVMQLAARLAVQSPAQRLHVLRERCLQLQVRLCQSVQRRLHASAAQLQSAMRALQTISPLATLERGYAIVTDSSAHILRDADAVQPGDRVSARLARGRLHCAVEEIDLDPQDQKV
jgi:exodeoxyribonuclease VII large subunit